MHCVSKTSGSEGSLLGRLIEALLLVALVLVLAIENLYLIFFFHLHPVLVKDLFRHPKLSLVFFLPGSVLTRYF